MNKVKEKSVKPIGFNNEKLSLNDGIIHSTMNKLSLNSQKSWIYLAYRSFLKLKEKDSFDIPVKDLTTYLQIDTRNYTYLNDCLKNIRRTYITYNITGKDSNNWIESPLLADVGIIDGNIVYSFSPFIREKLQDPKFFTILNLTLISNFKSKYSLAIYRQLASYVIKNQTITQKKYTLEELKYYLQIEQEYSEFRLFNNKVLKPAIEEINQFSPLSVSIDFKRENRKISEIKFTFSLKKDIYINQVVGSQNIDKEENRVLYTNKIETFCLENNYSLSLLEKYKNINIEKGINEVKYNDYLEFIIDSINKIKSKINKAGLLTNSLKDGRYIESFNPNRTEFKDLALDNKMKEIIEQETILFLKSEYEKYKNSIKNDNTFSFDDFVFNFEKNRAKDLNKFKRIIFHTRCGSIYGTSPYLVKTTIIKRLNL
ncbi:MAG: replication initiation protein [Candidatus Sericytochromatia bacterium]